MRRDLIHKPEVEGEEGRCAECGAWMPLDVAISAIGTPNGAVLEVGGLGAFCVTERKTLGREAIVCSHPSVGAQKREITVAPCPACNGAPQKYPCGTCDGSGMVAVIPDLDNPANSQVVKVEAGGLDDEQLQREGLSVERIPATTDFEKRVSRGAMANWLGMRDLIRQEGDLGT